MSISKFKWFLQNIEKKVINFEFFFENIQKVEQDTNKSENFSQFIQQIPMSIRNDSKVHV